MIKMVGIYKITNKVNGKSYIGQSWNIPKRWREHKSKSHYNRNIYLHRSINKYGIENFTFDIICYFNNTEETQFLLNEAECFFIKWYQTNDKTKGYNKMLGGANGKHSEETKKKMSFDRIGNKNAMFGKHHSQETIKKMIESRSGEKHYLYNKHLSEETKNKLSAANTGDKNPNARKVICIETKEIFDCIKDVEKKYGFFATNISRCCNGKLKTVKGYHWEFYKGDICD